MKVLADNLANILTLGVLLVAFWGAHVSNVKRLKSSAAELTEMKVKLDMIFAWFQHNVVGKGERPRTMGGSE
jgi:hypothetical protein